MEVFSLEDDQYEGMFITQEPSTSVKEVDKLDKSDENDRFLGVKPMDFMSPSMLPTSKLEKYVPVFSDISDDNFEEIEKLTDGASSQHTGGSFSDGDAKDGCVGVGLSQILGMNSRKRIFGRSRLATTKSVSKACSFKCVSESELTNLKMRWLKRRTFNKMQWGVRTFKEWRDAKLSYSEKVDAMLLDVDLDSVSGLSKESLKHALCRFIPEVTKKEGKDYPGKTLYEMLMSIQKYLNPNNILWYLLDDPFFLDVKTVLDNVMKERARDNVGMVKKQAQLITIDYENELWKSGVLGEDSPDKLRDTVLFLLGINLALRAGDEHHDLR